MDLFDLVAKITLDTSEYESGLSEASEETSSFGSSLASGIGTAAKVGGAAIAAVGTAAVAAGGALLSATGETANYGDNIDKMSQKLGLSTEAYQKWDYVLGQSGTSIDSMQTGLKTLTNQMDSALNGGEDAQEMFEKLGISMDDLGKMSREDLFEAAIAGFQKMEDSTERAALANDLFGKSGQNLTPLFNTTIEETQEMMQAAENYGFVLSEEAVKASADYNDALDTMQRTMGGFKNSLMMEFMPGLTTVMEGLTEIFSGDSDKGIAMISEGINDVITGITEKLPEFIEIGAGIIEAILEAITENLPKLMESGADIIMRIANAIIDNLPDIVKTGLEVIVSLATGIAENLPELIPAIVDVILEIVDILTQPDSVVMLVNAALQIILAIAQGLIDAIPRLVEAVPQIISNLVQAFAQAAPQILKAGVDLLLKLVAGIVQTIPKVVAAVPKIFTAFFDGIKKYYNNLITMGKNVITQFKNGIWGRINEARTWGRDLIRNFINGIKDMWNSLKSQFTSLGNLIKSYIGFSEPEIGPLSNFHTYAPDMMDLFIKGIRDNEDRLKDQIADTFSFQSSITGPEFSSGGRTWTNNTQDNRPITVVMMLNETELGRTTFRLNNAETQRIGVKLARGYA